MLKLKAISYDLKATSGFTLIELLIVIAIIAILAGVVFVSLNPLKRFQDARNSARWTDITAVLSAIKVDQVDNGGSYFTDLARPSGSYPATYPMRNYMIGAAVTGCSQSEDVPLASCPSGATTTDSCISLQELVDQGYLARTPVSPNGVGAWDSNLSGYYLSRNTNGSVTVGACDAEGSATITVNR